MLRPLLLLLALSYLSTACAPDDQEHCSHLQTSVERQLAQLPKSCQVTSDCHVAFLPPAFVAPHSHSDLPPTLIATANTYDRDCPAVVRSNPGFDAVCDDQRGVPPFGQCVLTFAGQPIENLDQWPDALCACATHEDCPPTLLCRAKCLCEDPCTAACRWAESCGSDALVQLGLGADTATCIAVCEVNYHQEEIQERVRCIIGAACDRMADCLPPPATP